MRMNRIKSTAHWVVISFLLLFPIVLVGVSNFAETQTETIVNYKYESNEVNTINDLVDGNIYHFEMNNPSGTWCQFLAYAIYDFNCESTTIHNLSTDNILNSETKNNNTYYFIVQNNFLSFIQSQLDHTAISSVNYINPTDYAQITKIKFNFVFKEFSGLSGLSISDYISKCENIPIESIEYLESSLKSDIYNWINSFVNLSINGWYLELLNIIGVPFIYNSIMSVMYVYPLYVIWVYVFDLLTDLILVIVKLGHNALHRLGGENE